MTRFWHPFANMGKVQDEELVIKRGEGCLVWDADGNQLIDAAAGLWYCNVGHGREEIAAAMQEQAATLASCSSFESVCNERALEVCERISAMSPLPGAAVFLTSGGSDAVDTAAKLARRYWFEQGKPEKTIVISREGSYHGAHAYGTSLAGIPGNREGYGTLIPEVARVPKLDAEALADEIDRIGSERVAAFFAEPVVNAGLWPPVDDYLTKAREICRERDVLYVSDEVVTGFGRIGADFASARFGIDPDMILFAKGSTSGYLPLGGVIISERVQEPFWRRGEDVWFRHGYTYSGHATVCAAAMANLDILEREQLPQRVAEREDDFRLAFEKLLGLPEISAVRAAGFACGVQLDPELTAADPTLPGRAIVAVREHGLLTRMLSGFAFQISPPLIISDEEIAQVVQAITDGLASIRDSAPVGVEG
jgi:putrescine---pyruvate transaminase